MVLIHSRLGLAIVATLSVGSTLAAASFTAGAEAQGEAIAFAADNNGFYTTSKHGSRPGATTAQAPLTLYEVLQE